MVRTLHKTVFHTSLILFENLAFKKLLDIASKGPILSADVRNEFKLNRMLNFTCSFKKSRPKPKLTWRIDGQIVSIS